MSNDTLVKPTTPTELAVWEQHKEHLGAELKRTFAFLASYKGEVPAALLATVEADLGNAASDLDKMVNNLKDQLRKLAQQAARPDPESPQRRVLELPVSGGYTYRATLTRTRATEPDLDKLGELLASKGLDSKAACRKVVSYELDKERLGGLLADGKLTQAEVDTCRPEKGEMFKAGLVRS